jgi:hypothetical protein
MGKKISQLTPGTSVIATDLFEKEIVSPNSSAYITGQILIDFITPSNISTIKFSLTSVQILQLFSTPLLVIAAPSNLYAIRVLEYSANLIFATTAYTSSANDLMLITDTATTGQMGVQIFTATATSHRRGFDLSGVSPTTTGQLIAGKALYVQAATQNPTLGDSPIDIYITYELLKL